MKKTMIILITLLIVILFISFNKSSKEEIVIKDDNKIDLMIKEEKPKYKKEVVVKTTQEVVQKQKELPLPDLDIEAEAIIESEDDVFLPPLSDLKNQSNPDTVVLKKFEDYLPSVPVAEVKEGIEEESYFYEGRIISKQEYLRLNINEDVHPEDLVTDENEFSFDNVDNALKDLAPEPIKIKKVVKKKASNTPDLNDLFN